MTRMLNVADVLKLIIDGLDDGSFAKQQLVGQREQTILHLFTKFGNKLNCLCNEKLLGKRLGKVAFLTKEFAEEVGCQFGNRTAIIDIARSQAKGEQFAPLIDAPGAA